VNRLINKAYANWDKIALWVVAYLIATNAVRYAFDIHPNQFWPCVAMYSFGASMAELTNSRYKPMSVRKDAK
jgi:hypothetical protein